MAGCCEFGNEPPGSIKYLEFFWLAEHLLCSQEGLCSTQLISYKTYFATKALRKPSSWNDTHSWQDASPQHKHSEITKCSAKTNLLVSVFHSFWNTNQCEVVHSDTPEDLSLISNSAHSSLHLHTTLGAILSSTSCIIICGHLFSFLHLKRW